MDKVFDIILKWVIPFICAQIATACIGYVRGLRKKNKAEAEKADKEFNLVKLGLQALLRAEILRAYEKYTCKGYCPIYAREALDRAYQVYHGLGGNDVATDLYNQIKALPSSPNTDDTIEKGE